MKERDIVNIYPCRSLTRSKYLDTEFAKGLRRKQRTDLGHNRSIETADHDLVAFVEDTIRQDHVDCRTKTFDDLDLKHSTLELREVHQPIAHALLGKVDEEHDHVGHTLSRNRRGRDDGDITREVLVVVVEAGVQTLLGEGNDDLLGHVLELALDGPLLRGERAAEVVVGYGLPAVDTVDLVESNDERRLPVPEQTQRLQSLWLKTVLQKPHEHQPKSREEALTMISTTRMAMLQSELPRERKLVNDS